MLLSSTVWHEARIVELGRPVKERLLRADDKRGSVQHPRWKIGDDLGGVRPNRTKLTGPQPPALAKLETRTRGSG